jgi:Mrp family chromosome partitioning ATPase
MSNIYKALQKHKTPPWTPPKPGPSLSSGTGPAMPTANAEMQTLYKSIEAALDGVEGGKIILFSSSRPSEGKSTVAGEFATTLAVTFGLSVLVLDADRRHALCRRFNARPENGLEQVLKTPAEKPGNAGRGTGIGSVIAVPLDISSSANPSGTLDAALPVEVAKELKQLFNYVLIDTPALSDAPWGVSLARQTDGVILVVEAERTRWPVVRHAKQEFERADAKVLGVFLNKRRFHIPRRIYERL